MSDWRTVKSLANDRDDCGLCKHSRTEASTGYVLCSQPDVIECIGRGRVSVGVARVEVCRGEWWRPAGNTSKTRQNGVKTGGRSTLEPT